MKIEELITILQSCNKTLPVFVVGQEYSYELKAIGIGRKDLATDKGPLVLYLGDDWRCRSLTNI